MFVVIIIFLVDIDNALIGGHALIAIVGFTFDASSTFSCMRWVGYGATVQMHSDKLSKCQR
jgi:hypothetical protein